MTRLADYRLIGIGGIVYLTEASLLRFGEELLLSWRYDEDFASWAFEGCVPLRNFVNGPATALGAKSTGFEAWTTARESPERPPEATVKAGWSGGGLSWLHRVLRRRRRWRLAARASLPLSAPKQPQPFGRPAVTGPTVRCLLG
jgi:hypothetical protein